MLHHPCKTTVAHKGRRYQQHFYALRITPFRSVASGFVPDGYFCILSKEWTATRRKRFAQDCEGRNREVAGRGGFEPPTTGFGVPRSTKLSYRPTSSQGTLSLGRLSLCVKTCASGAKRQERWRLMSRRGSTAQKMSQNWRARCRKPRRLFPNARCPKGMGTSTTR